QHNFQGFGLGFNLNIKLKVFLDILLIYFGQSTDNPSLRIKTATSGFITTPIQSENNSNSETFSTAAIIVKSTCSSSNFSKTALVAKSTHLTSNTIHNLSTETITNTIVTTTHNPTNIVSILNNINTNTNSNPYDEFFINILSDLSNMSGQRTSTRITHQISTLIDMRDRNNNENNRH
ncbi:16270_t:CDS:2, partial [Dentiscutata erythropus]